jgi:hypothetical protein
VSAWVSEALFREISSKKALRPDCLLACCGQSVGSYLCSVGIGSCWQCYAPSGVPSNAHSRVTVRNLNARLYPLMSLPAAQHSQVL